MPQMVALISNMKVMFVSAADAAAVMNNVGGEYNYLTIPVTELQNAPVVVYAPGGFAVRRGGSSFSVRKDLSQTVAKPHRTGRPTARR